MKNNSVTQPQIQQPSSGDHGPWEWGEICGYHRVGVGVWSAQAEVNTRPT